MTIDQILPQDLEVNQRFLHRMRIRFDEIDEVSTIPCTQFLSNDCLVSLDNIVSRIVGQ